MSEHVLDVRLHEKSIGTLTTMAGDQNLFAFNDTYINDPKRATLSLSFKSAGRGLITDIKPTRTRLSPFFSNLLPEGHLRKYLAKKAAVKDAREFYLINALGHDLPGAVTVHYAGHHGNIKKISDKNQVAQPPAGSFRFSLAGVQLKFSAIMETTGGLAIPAL
jgi:serine/threonine-protein kinase HipA